jgi:hypothetical protein
MMVNHTPGLWWERSARSIAFIWAIQHHRNLIDGWLFAEMPAAEV